LSQDEKNVKSIKTDISETFLSESGKETMKSDIQRVPFIHGHLGPGMEPDSGSSNDMEIRPADAEWLIQNAQELNGESTRSDFLRNYRLYPDVQRRQKNGATINLFLPRQEGTFTTPDS
jgi:hypothetical protein